MNKPTLLVDEIRQIGEAMRHLLSSGLTERALVILVSEATKVSRTDVQEVIRCLPNLDKLYIRKAP